MVDFLTKLSKFNEQHEWWSLHMGDFSNKKGSGVNMILKDADEIIFEQTLSW